MATRLFERAKPIGNVMQIVFSSPDANPAHTMSVIIPRESARELAEQVIAALRRTEAHYYPGIVG